MAAGLAKAYMQTVDEHKRLVHAIQLERGCSCAFVGAGGTLEQFDALVRKHRTLVDANLDVATQSVRTVVNSSLLKIRALIDSVRETSDDSSPQLATLFYSALMGFTQLIDQLIQDIDEFEIPEQNTGSFKKNTAKITAAQAFAHVKESYGFQRAFICGVLALPEAELPHLPARAFADFVIGISRLNAEQQAVRAAAPPSLLHMLSAGFDLHPSLKAIQEVLLRDFDVVSVCTPCRAAMKCSHTASCTRRRAACRMSRREADRRPAHALASGSCALLRAAVTDGKIAC